MGTLCTNVTKVAGWEGNVTSGSVGWSWLTVFRHYIQQLPEYAQSLSSTVDMHCMQYAAE